MRVKSWVVSRIDENIDHFSAKTVSVLPMNGNIPFTFTSSSLFDFLPFYFIARYYDHVQFNTTITAATVAQ